MYLCACVCKIVLTGADACHSLSLAQIRKAVTSRTRATREVTIIHTQHDRIRDDTDSDCIVCFSRVSAARGCCEVCCWSASVSLNTSHYAAPDQRGGYQQKQGYHRGAYEHHSVSSSPSALHELKAASVC